MTATPGRGGNPVLKALDLAKTQSYHFKTIVIAGMGFLTDSYDLFAISIFTKLLGRLYYYNENAQNPGVLPLDVNAAVVGTVLVGTLMGQLFFGWLGDKWGRKKAYGFTLALMIAATLGQGLSIQPGPKAVIGTLCFFRFWLGFGIGGEYPLSATIMSEYSNVSTRGSFVAAVFAMQGFGILLGAIVSLAVISVAKKSHPRGPFAGYPPLGHPKDLSTPQAADWVWRLVLMFGAVPAAVTLYARSTMPETARYTALVSNDQKKAAKNMAKVLQMEFSDVEDGKSAKQLAKATQYRLLSGEFVRRHGLELFGTCATWFLLDVSFYSQNLFQGQIFTAAGWLPAPKYMSGLDEAYRQARAQALIALFSTVPGYWFTVVFVDVIGRKPIQMMGFAFMSVFLYILAFDFYDLRGHEKNPKTGGYYNGNHTAFIILYALTFFFSNFGPNATTFIIPAELFPARLRSTCHGISSASGKAGAIVGAFGFLYASQDKHTTPVGSKYPTGIGYKYTILLLAISATIGLIVTAICIPETKGRSLEELSGEDKEFSSVSDDVYSKALDSDSREA